MSASIVPWSDNACPCAASAASVVMFTPLQTEMSVWSARFEKQNECLAGCREEPLLGREGVFRSWLSDVKASVSKSTGKEFRGKYILFF